MDVLFIDAAGIRDRVSMGALIEALRAGHRAEPPLMERVLMEPEGSPNRFLVWHAWGSIVVSKLVTVFPDNPRRSHPHPAVQALITAFDGDTGAPIAIVDGTELTYWKTAASSGLAADILAPSEPTTLLVIGAGGLAPHLVRAHLTVRPSIEKVLVWNRTRRKAEAMVSMFDSSTEMEVVDDLDAGIGAAQIISSATASPEPLIAGARLRHGTHLDLVGGFTPTMREADDDAVRRSRLFVDAAMFTIDHCGDIVQPISRGVIGRDDVLADLFGLCRGEHQGRGSPDEITMFKSGGGAHLDLMATRHVLEVFA